MLDQKTIDLAALDGGEYLDDRTFLFKQTDALEKRLRAKLGAPKRPGLFGPHEYWYYTENENSEEGYICTTLADYKVSYDAILPLIQKQKPSIRYRLVSKIANCPTSAPATHIDLYTMATPSQLCDALLAAIHE